MRIKQLFLTLALLFTMVQGAWAQKLNFCTASDVNRVVCTDGSIYDNASAATAAGKTAVAKIIYIDEENKKGLALALKDEGSFRWEGANTVCSNKNTSLPFEDATWKLASKDEWDKMINAAGGYTALRDGFAAVGGDNIRMGQYWSGDDSGSSFVFVYKFVSGEWTTLDTKSREAECNVRLCLQFNLFTLYEIGSQNEWSAFCTAVNNGDTFNGKYVKLTADISVSEMAGSSESNSFQGLFDGDGHTLTVSYNTEEAVTAPFRYVKNATIRNLKTTGTITTSAMSAAGIVGDVTGSLKLSSCNSSVSISCSRGGIDTHGGLVASNNGNVTISGCAFNGSFAATVAHNNSNGTTDCGGIVGMCNENTSTTITNSLVAPSSVAEGMVSNTFVGLYGVATVTIENCYFVATANLPTNQGMQVYYTAPANGIYKSITFFGTTVYSDACSVSGVEATYNLDNGLASVTPMLTDPSAAPLTFGTDYTATLNGNAVQNLPVKISTAGSYTLVLTGTGNYAGSKTFNITATGDVVNSALAISSEEQWNAFAESVNNGNNYSDKFVKLNSDISVSTMVGSSETNSFQGTFLGDGVHTLTFTAGSSSAAFGEENCAPFRYTKDATIRDLKVAGDIYTSRKFAAGLVASCYGTTTITNCQIGTVIHSSVSGDGTHGGIVAMPAGSTTTNITGCVYNGRLLTTSGTQYCGGFVGWSGDNTVTVTHSLYAPDANIVVAAGETAIDNGATFVRGNKPTVEANCYYTKTMGGAQGTKTYVFDVAPGFLGETVGASDLATYYTNGILYDGKYYVAPIISLADNADNSAVINAANGYVADVTLDGRTFYRDGAWNTLCLPFNATKTGPLAKTVIKELDTETAYDGHKTGFEDGTLYLNFKDAESIVAGQPYIVKWSTVDYYLINPSDEVIAALDFITEVPTFDGGQETNWGAEEGAEKLVDGNTATKYGLGNANPWVEFHYTKAITPKGYALMTAEDTKTYGSRNPKSWTIKAKNSGDADWTTLTTVDNTNKDKLPTANNQWTVFALDNSTAYQYFRFEAEKNSDFQLAELRFCNVQPGSTEIVNPTFETVALQADAPTAVTSEDGKVSFTGTYSPVSIYTDEKTNLYLGAENTLYYPTDEGFQVNAFRGYFQLNGLTAGKPSDSNQASVRAFKLNFGDGETTGIISVHDSGFMVNGSDAWYSLDGRKLNGKPTAKGIYINNGRKVAIK